MKASVVAARKRSPAESFTALHGSRCRIWKSSFPVGRSQMRMVWSAEPVISRSESPAQGFARLVAAALLGRLASGPARCACSHTYR